jgi:hypothetical protein
MEARNAPDRVDEAAAAALRASRRTIRLQDVTAETARGVDPSATAQRGALST